VVGMGSEAESGRKFGAGQDVFAAIVCVRVVWMKIWIVLAGLKWGSRETGLRDAYFGRWTSSKSAIRPSRNVRPFKSANFTMKDGNPATWFDFEAMAVGFAERPLGQHNENASPGYRL
jgi:hypothetical protein